MKRIAVYCRVSTEKDEQLNSFESQQRYFQTYIEEKSEWELYKIYADEGISGTSTKRRKAFNQMIEDAKEGKFDFIITKEVSRFARNTVDTLQYTRELKKMGIEVYFTMDHIHTMEPDAELRLTIMASIAQEESRKISERVKWGQKRRMEQGIVFGRDLIGYDVRCGKLFVNEEGAKIVRLIYYKFLEEEKGVSTIARELTENNILTVTNQTHWSGTTVLRILKNEKYCGDLIQKKTVTLDYLTHQKQYNDGLEEKVVIHNHHEAIITREQFERVQKELERRSIKKREKITWDCRNQSKYTNRYPLSGKIRCGHCGSSFVSRIKKRGDGTSYCTWRCYEVVRYGKKNWLQEDVRTEKESSLIRGCDMNVAIQDRDFMGLIQKAIKQQFVERNDGKEMIGELIEIIEKILQIEDGKTERDIREKKVEGIQKKIERLVELYVSESISKIEYDRMLTTYKNRKQKLELEMNNEIGSQQKDVNVIEEGSKKSLEKENKLTIIKQSLEVIVSGQCQDGNFYRRMIEKIIVNGREEIEVYFRFKESPWKGNLKKEKYL